MSVVTTLYSVPLIDVQEAKVDFAALRKKLDYPPKYEYLYIDKSADSTNFFVWKLSKSNASIAIRDFIRGDHLIHEELEDGYGTPIRYFNPTEVKNIAEVLVAYFSKDNIQKVYDKEEMENYGIYMVYQLEEVLDHFKFLTEFYAEASTKNHCVLSKYG